MRIIDPHVHIWVNDPAFPWPAEKGNPPEDDRSAEMLLEIMETNGVSQTVLVHPIHYLWDNSYVTYAVNKYPDKFMGVGRLNPEDPAAPDHASMWMEKGLHGMRLSPSGDGENDWFDGPLMVPIFARLESLGVPLLMLTGAKRLPRLAQLMDQHPNLQVCIDHMASVHPDDAEGRQALLDLARYPQVFVKISHTWTLSHEGYPWRDTYDQVEAIYQTFGADRIMWGTDWPVCLSKAEYAQALTVVRDEMKFIAPQDLEWVLGKTVLRLWDFDAK